MYTMQLRFKEAPAKRIMLRPVRLAQKCCGNGGKGCLSDSGIVMVDGTVFGDCFKQDQSWDDSGTTISGI